MKFKKDDVIVLKDGSKAGIFIQYNYYGIACKVVWSNMNIDIVNIDHIILKSEYIFNKQLKEILK